MDNVGTTRSERNRFCWKNWFIASTPLLILTLIYLCDLVSSAYWLDSSELAAAGFSLGIPHPPGHPLYLFFGKALSWLPMGPIGLKLSLLSASMGILCCGLAAIILKDTVELFTGRTKALEIPLLWTTVGLFGLSSAMWLQSIRPEVYTLQTALNLGILHQLLRAIRPHNSDLEVKSAFFMATFLLGLGGLNHHYLALFMVPTGLYVLTSLCRRPGLSAARLVGGGAIFATVPLLGYAFLPIRAAQNPYINWVDPESISRFLDVVFARVFHASVTDTEGVNWAMNLVHILFLYMEQTSPLLFPFFLLGAFILWKKSRQVFLVLSLSLLSNSLASAVMSFDRLNPDTWGYLQLSMAIWILISLGGIGFALQTLCRAKPETLKLASFALALLTVFSWGGQWDRFHERANLGNFDSTERIEDEILKELPPSSLHLSSFFGLFFNHWYAQVVDGRRPDVTIVSQSFDQKIHGGVPYIQEQKVRSPQWSAVFDSFLESGQVPVGLLKTIASYRPIFFEVETPSPFASQSVSRGMIQQICTGCDQQVGHQLTEGIIRRLHGSSEWNPETRTIMVWHHYHTAALLQKQGKAQPFRNELDRGKKLAPMSRHWGILESSP